jgi:hypothetical protein
LGTVLLGPGFVVVAGPGLCANAAAERVSAMPSPNALKCCCMLDPLI